MHDLKILENAGRESVHAPQEQALAQGRTKLLTHIHAQQDATAQSTVVPVTPLPEVSQ
ncbi:hypothetical protein [Kocuria sp.]|uniref:hypothetical protein n=1 Tax=Kocuria sp. TaxID=1871328 RepID=UPI0026DF2956|nr:hypothetical protein [Kocuria sp.]MDO5618508.1 hypothetical protein [Kocuria sp.]